MLPLHYLRITVRLSCVGCFLASIPNTPLDGLLFNMGVAFLGMDVIICKYYGEN